MKTIILSILSILIVSVYTQNSPTCGTGTIPDSCNLAAITLYISTSLNLPTCKDKTPTFTDCKPDCKPVPCDVNITVSCKPKDELPVCEDALPTLDSNFCVTCRPEFKECKLGNLVTCTDGLKIVDGCPSCVPATCILSSIKPCEEGQDPEFDGACPKCVPIRLCTQKCADRASIRDCADDEKPEFNINSCCPTCIRRTRSCTAEAVSECNATLHTLPSCVGTETMKVNYSSCCFSGCKCVTPTKPVTCTVSDYITCRKSTPVCSPNEVPCFTEGSCCASCKITELSFLPQIVTRCLSQRDDCEDDEEPTDVDGEPCKSCRRVPDFTKFVDVTCVGDDKMVVGDWDFGKSGAVFPIKTHCVSKKTLKLVLEALDDASNQTIRYIKNHLDTTVDVYFYLQAIFDRACAMDKYKEICAVYKANFRNIRIIKISVDIALHVEFDIPNEHFQATGEFEFKVAGAKRALLQSTTPAESTSQIVSDPSVTDTPATATPAPPASSTTGPVPTTTTPSTTATTTPSTTSPTTGSNEPSYGTSIVSSFVMIAMCMLTLF